MRAWTRRGCVLPVVALLVLGAGAAHADEVRTRRMRFAERGGNLVVTTSFPELFRGDAAAKLASGFPTTVVVRLYVFRSDRELPSSFALATSQVVYDLWGETYSVRIDRPGGSRSLRTASRAEVVSTVTRIEELPVASLEQVPIGPHHFLAVVVELNPVSEELLAEVRRWLTRPAGASRLDTSSSFFGSFVSVFVNPKLERADRVIRLRSQPFYRVPR